MVPTDKEIKNMAFLDSQITMVVSYQIVEGKYKDKTGKKELGKRILAGFTQFELDAKIHRDKNNIVQGLTPEKVYVGATPADADTLLILLPMLLKQLEDEKAARPSCTCKSCKEGKAHTGQTNPERDNMII